MPYADPGTPPLTSAPAYLWWVARGQLGLVLSAIFWGSTAFVAAAMMPYLLGRVVDHGIDHGLSPELWRGCLALLGVGALQALANVMDHRRAVESWIRAAFRSSQLLGHHVSRTGDAVTTELPTGEVVATVASDSLRVGDTFWIGSRLVGAIIAYFVVAVLLLRASVTLGVAVLVGLPLVAAILALVVKPLQRRQAAQREASGRLTTLGTDTVTGLRILRGIGGEEAFAARYREQSQTVRRAGVSVAQTQSVLDALQALLPGLLLAGVVWYGARLALAGEITPGQLVTFYGYAAFLTEPLHAATEAVQIFSRALVGVRKILKVLAVPVTGADTREAPFDPAGRPAGLASPAPTLTDGRTGVVVPAGRVTALVSADPDESAAVALRLGLLGVPDAAAHVTLDGTPLAELGLAEVRRRVLVAESTPQLFTGVLRSELDATGTADEARTLAALQVADALDVLEALPDGLDGEVAEKGRSFSGGQRQRLALARAVLVDPEVLLLVEPTSAVDAHSEARIAERLVASRAGRTTVVVSASPLVLDRVDEVVLVGDGTVLGRGTHRELSADHGEVGARYRAVVSRAAGDENGQTSAELNGQVPAPRTEEVNHEAACR